VASTSRFQGFVNIDYFPQTDIFGKGNILRISANIYDKSHYGWNLNLNWFYM